MPEPIRVLQVMASLDRGGAETVVMDWLRRLDRTKVTLDFVVNEGGPYAFEQEAVELGSRVFRAPLFQGWNVASYALWWRRFLVDHPEWAIVHAHHTVPAATYLGVARKLGRVTVAHSHSAGRENTLLGVMRTGLRWPLRYIPDVHLACSNLAGTWMFGRKAGARVIPNGIETERFAFDAQARVQGRSELGLDETLVVGHVGSFSFPKNHGRLLRIFAAIAEREPRARLLLVGDGGRRSWIEHDVRVRGLEDKVLMAGVRKDIPAVLSAMDVLLFPSHYEGLPVSVVEAQASGLQCVVSDAVTPEIALTDLVSFLSLDESDEIWAAKVLLEAGSRSSRRSRVDELREAGYDSAQVAAEMQRLYLELMSEHG